MISKVFDAWRNNGRTAPIRNENDKKRKEKWKMKGASQLFNDKNNMREVERKRDKREEWEGEKTGERGSMWNQGESDGGERRVREKEWNRERRRDCYSHLRTHNCIQERESAEINQRGKWRWMARERKEKMEGYEWNRMVRTKLPFSHLLPPSSLWLIYLMIWLSLSLRKEKEGEPRCKEKERGMTECYCDFVAALW